MAEKPVWDVFAGKMLTNIERRVNKECATMQTVLKGVINCLKCYRIENACQNATQGPVSRKNLIRASYFQSSVHDLKGGGGVYTPKTSCMKRKSVM